MLFYSRCSRGGRTRTPKRKPLFDTKHDPLFEGRTLSTLSSSTAGENYVVLFQIQQCTLTPSLIELLSRADILKTGVALGRDVDELKQVIHFKQPDLLN